MIEKLTPEQEAKIEEYCQWGLETFLSTETDKETAEQSIDLLYQCADLEPPKSKIWLADPGLGDLVSNSFLMANSPTSVWRNFFCGVVPEADRKIGALIDPKTRRQLSATFREIRSQKISLNGAEVISHIRSQMASHLKGKIWGSYPWTGWHNVPRPGHGCHDAYKAAYYSYCSDVLNISLELTKGFRSTVHCGWYWPFENVAILTPKPLRICLDAGGRLHSDGEPALCFPAPSTFEIWVWHGVRLPKQYQIPSALWEPDWLLSEKNVEMRRILIQGVGYDKLYAFLGVKKIDACGDYELIEINREIDIEPVRLVRMICQSTGNTHTLRVPPEIDSAKEAIKWCNWGIDPADFLLET